MKSLLVAALLAATTITAHAQPADRKAPPPAWSFDKTGWTYLGSATVDGKKDRDTITVGKYEGKFDELTIVVTDSDLQLEDFTVVFGNGDKFSPKLKHTFKEGQRSRAIDMPGNDRVIQKIELLYKNTPGGGKARLEVYGRDKRNKKPDKPGTPPPPSGGNFDKTGWTFLGDRSVDGRRDKDSIKVGKYEGHFDQVTMLVSDSDLDLKDITFVFGNGEKWSPHLAHVFKEGQRSRAIDLPGNNRTISRIDLNYANLPGGGKAHVELYGRDLKRPAPPPIVPVTWENKGWAFLGKSTVDGWRDRDKINVVIGQPFTELMFVVAGSDVEISNIVVTLGNNEKFEMKDKVVFKEGTRTNPIDIPGKLRKIKSIEFAYANLPGGGRATVEVWARKKGSGADAPKPPPPGTPPPPPPGAPPPPAVRDHK